MNPEDNIGAFQYSRSHAAQEDRLQDKGAQFSDAILSGITETDRRWAWVEISLGAIETNISRLRSLCGSRVRIMAVVKADAYGHGAVQCARAALRAGASYLGVATVDEGIELRKAGLTDSILILSQPPIESAPLLLQYNLMPSIYTSDFAIAYAEVANTAGVVAPYHLAVNTGMNRIGVHYAEVYEFLQTISFHRALKLVGTFTHFATADAPETFDFQMQAKHFLEALHTMTGANIDPGIVHAAGSAAAMRFGDVHFNMVRPGIMMYGLQPCAQTQSIMQLEPAMSVHARVTDLRRVPVSEGVSYGFNYRSPGSVVICTIPVGYADGLCRGLSGRTGVIMGGQMLRQVGNICMDQCMFEIDLRSSARHATLNPNIGDEVLLVGKQGEAEITLDEMASKLGTITHEIAIGFSQRMPRIYK